MEDNRKKVYDKLVSDTGYKDSYEDFNKLFDASDENKKKVYDVLSAKTGYKDSYDDFVGLMKIDTPATEPSQPAIAEPSQEESVQTFMPDPKVKDRILGNIPDMFQSKGDNLATLPLERGKDELEERIRLAERATKDPYLLNEQNKGMFPQLEGKIKDARMKRAQERMKETRKAGGDGLFSTLSQAYVAGSMNDEDRQLEYANTLLEEAKNISQAAADNKDNNFFENFAQGFKDAPLDGWAMGIQDFKNASAAKKVVDKIEKGEELNEAEDALMQAMVVNAAAKMYNADNVGRGYTVGQITSQSLPFMLDMIVGMGATQAATKPFSRALLKYATKKAREIGAKKGSVDMMLRRGLAKGVSSIQDAALHTATFGGARVGADYLARQVGQTKTGVDLAGAPTYEGQTGQQYGAEALGKAFISTGAESWSELVGQHFADMLGFVAKVTKADKLGKIFPSSIGKAYSGMTSSKAWKEMRKFADAAKITDPLGEYAEEMLNNLVSLSIGDMSAEELTDLDNNIDTFLGVMPISVLFGSAGAAGYAKERYKARKSMKEFENTMRENFGEEWNELREVLSNSTIEDAREFVKDIIRNPAMGKNEKSDAIRYIYTNLQENALQGNDLSSMPDEIMNNKKQVYDDYMSASKKLDFLTDEQKSYLQFAEIEDIDEMQLDEQQKETVAEYIGARQAFDVYVGRVDAMAREARAQAESQLETLTNATTGNVTQVMSGYSDKPVYILRGGLVFNENGTIDKAKSDQVIYFRDENGEVKMGPIENFDELVSETPFDAMAQQVGNEAAQEVLDTEREEVDPTIPQNTTFSMNGVNYAVGQRTADGYQVYQINEEGIPENSVIMTSHQIREAINTSENIAQNETFSPSEENTLSNRGTDTLSNQPQMQGEAVAEEVQQPTALSQIPTDESGNPNFEAADGNLTASALMEMNENDVDEAKDTAAQMINFYQGEMKKAEKMKTAASNPVEIQNLKAEKKQAIKAIQDKINYWQSVSDNIEGMRKGGIIEEAKQEAEKNQERLSAMSEEEIAAAQAKVQENIDKGVYERTQPKGKVRYITEDGMLGEAQTPMEFVLRSIATGETKFKWKDEGATKGLGSHLGFSSAPTEMRKRIWALSNDGFTPESAAEAIHASMPESFKGMVTDQDVFNMIVNAMVEYGTPGKMFDAAKAIRGTDIEESIEGYDEYQQKLADEWDAANNNMTVQEWNSYVEAMEESTDELFSNFTDEEVNGIYNEIAEEYERERANQGSTEMVSEQQQDNIGAVETSQDTQPAGEVSEQGDGNVSVEQEVAKEQTEKDPYDLYVENIQVNMGSFPKNPSSEVITKTQKGGKRADAARVDVAFNGNDLHIRIKTFRKTNEYIIPNARDYRAQDIAYRIDMGIGTTTDAARLSNDAILELFNKNSEPFGLRSIFQNRKGSQKEVTPTQQAIQEAEAEVNTNQNKKETIEQFRQRKIEELLNIKDEDIKKSDYGYYFDAIKVTDKNKSKAIAKKNERVKENIENIKNGGIDWMYDALYNKETSPIESKSLSETTEIPQESVEESTMSTIEPQPKGIQKGESVLDYAKRVAEEQENKSQPKEQPAEYGSQNKIVSSERYEELKKRMRAKLNNLNAGYDPELATIGAEMAAYHIEAGARKFADYAKRMLSDMGEEIRPYLKLFYNSVRDYPGMESLKELMESYDIVDKTDINSIKLEESTTTQDRFVKRIEDALGNYQLTIPNIRKIATEEGMTDFDDILLQELTELAIINKAKDIARKGGFNKETYDKIVDLYNSQPTISMRSSNRVEKQQYSTPIPMSYLADMFVMGENPMTILEPSAGNGMMVFAIPSERVHVNDIDQNRLDNLQKQGFNAVTSQDALTPFKDNYDAIVTNPPFGTTEAKEYGGYSISGLEHQMTINALESMKDNGRAAIIVGGNTEYSKNGTIKGKDKAFLNYLYNNYNVVDVINMSGDLYAKQGTKFPTRLILINGRKTIGDERFAPVQSKARAEQITTFDELYNRVNDESILRIQQGSVSDNNTAEEPVGGERINRESETSSRKQSKSESKSDRRSTRGSSRERVSDNNVASSNVRESAEQPSARRDDVRVDADANGKIADGQPAGSAAAGDRRSEYAGNDASGVYQTPRELDRKPVEVNIESEKTHYPAQSRATEIGSVVPTNTVQAIENILGQFEDIDDYVREKLGYDSKDSLYKALSAEQIDSVALAIRQMEEGQGFIIGDMTGVGKGRQAAALIRYAVRKGMKPIFMTEKANLFSDIYRDLRDIGSPELVPFIVNDKGDSDPSMTDEAGNVIYKVPSKAIKQDAYNKKEVPEGFDYVTITYSQLSSSDKRPSPKKDFFTEIAKDNIIIMDESHNAGGSGNTGLYLQEVLPNTKGVTFLSGTFAKRADNMPIYALKTNMSDANMSQEELIDAILNGGVPLQEIMSRNLVESGQMIRRERDYTGVTIDWLPMEGDVQKHKEAFNKVIEIFNDLIRFQRDYINPIIDGINDELADIQGSAENKKGTKDLGVSNTPFASKTFNLVRQLLFSLKAEYVADRAIMYAKQGLKPVIAVSNTMETFIKEEIPSDIDIASPDFSITLMKGLEGLFRYSEKTAKGDTKPGRIEISQLSEEGQRKYFELKKKIEESVSGLSISPIDVIKNKAKNAGFSIGELTGREFELQENEDGTVRKVKRVDKDKKKQMRDFNNGDLDMLILNQSASTGISLHASTRFADQRQRVMIFAQNQLDVNTEIQMRGRTDRTGQVHRSKYEYIISPIPAEGRLMMMFKSKLKSLDANTTSSQKSKVNEVGIVDFLNKYGDQVVVDYLKENPELSDKLLDPLRMSDMKEEEIEKLTASGGEASKVAGRVALLNVDEQEQFYKEISERYNTLINYLNESGTNDLEITVVPLNAKTISREVLVPGKYPDSNNAFADNSYLEQVEVDVIKKPMKAEEVRSSIHKFTEGRTANEYRNYLLDKVSEYEEAQIEKARKNHSESAIPKMEESIEKTRERVFNSKRIEESDKESVFAEKEQEIREKYQTMLNKKISSIKYRMQTFKQVFGMIPVGRTLLIPNNLGKEATGSGFSYGMLMGYKMGEKLSPSTTTAVFATLDGRRKIEIPLSKSELLQSIASQTMLDIASANSITLDNWDEKIPNRTRKNAYVVTGNVLQAYGTVPGGQLITYSTQDGEFKQGILLPDSFKKTDVKKREPITSKYNDIINGEMVTDSLKEVTFSKAYGVINMYVPQSKRAGGKYYLDKNIQKMVDGGVFRQVGSRFKAEVPEKNLKPLLEYLHKEFGTNVQVQAFDKSDDIRFRFIGEQGAANLDAAEEATTRLDNLAVAREMESQGKDANAIKMATGWERGADGKWRYETMEGKLKQGWEKKSERVQGVSLSEILEDKELFDAYPSLKEITVSKERLDYYGSYSHKNKRIDIDDRIIIGVDGVLAHEIQHAIQYIEGFSKGGSGYEIKESIEFYKNRLSDIYESEEYKKAMDDFKKEFSDKIDRKIEEDYSDVEESRKSIIKNALMEDALESYRYKIPILQAVSNIQSNLYELQNNSNDRSDFVYHSLGGEVEARNVQSRMDMTPEQRRQSLASETEDVAREDQIFIYNSLGNQSLEALTPEQQLAEINRKLKDAQDRSGSIMSERRNGVQEAAKALGIEVEIIEDITDLPEGKAKEAILGGKTVVGWYNLASKKIYIFLPYVNDRQDGYRTVLHEAVAHYGLRKLIGDENMNQFLRDLFESLNSKTQAKISDTFKKYDRPEVAMEEYLARMAENGVDTTFWEKVKYHFKRLMRKIGLNVRLNDNDIKYILWRSAQNLKENSVEDALKDAAMQQKLEVGKYRKGEYFREREPIQEKYDDRLNQTSTKAKEAFVDGTESLRVLMDVIEEESGRKAQSFENPHTAEQRRSSINKADHDTFMKDAYNPMMEQVKKHVQKNGEEKLMDYLRAKTGLERNEVFLQRDRDAADDQTLEPKDYSGLTALAEKYGEDDYTANAERLVSEYEKDNDVAELWDAIRKATRWSLDKRYKSGLLSQEKYEYIKGMMNYYLPLKGWEEETAGDLYDYKETKSEISRIQPKAKGRTSLSDNPILNIAMDAQSAIVAGNKNLVKQKLFNFVLNRPTDLVSVKRAWYVLKPDGTYELSMPDIDGLTNHEDISEEIERHEAEMKELKEKGEAKQKINNLDLGVRVDRNQTREHSVSVFVNGQEYVMYVNGNPRAAQAMNGRFNKPIQWFVYDSLKRLYGAGLTSYNPDFILPNLIRDSIHSATMTYITKGPIAMAKYLKNSPKAAYAVYRGISGKYDGRETDKMFKEFLENGGETGYTAINSIETYRKEYAKEIKELSTIGKVKSGAKLPLYTLGKWFSTANRIAEDINRFNAYMSTRQAGYTIEEAVDEAKNLTVNFNRKGAGYSAGGFWGAMAGTMQKFVLFANPTIQGLYQVGKATKDNKARMAGTVAAVFASGVLVPFFNELLVAACGDGDDDDYWAQTDYDRMNNMMLFIPGQNVYAKIPLPPFFREIYGMGDILYRTTTGKVTPEKATIAALKQINTAVVPLDILQEGEWDALHLIMPDLLMPLVDWATNKNFMGGKIANKTEWNELEPEYKKVFKGANQMYVGFSKGLSDLTGGDDVKAGWLDMNPEMMEHLITSYTGGIGKTISNIVGGITNKSKGEDVRISSIPIVRRFASGTDERTLDNYINKRYFDLVEQYEKLDHNFEGYMKEVKKGNNQYIENINDMANNGQKSFIEFMKIITKQVKQINDIGKNSPDNKEVKKALNELKMIAIEQGNKILKEE